MIAHGVSYDICDFLESAVIHLDEGMYDSPLNGLEAVLKLGNGPVPYNIGSVFYEILFK